MDIAVHNEYMDMIVPLVRCERSFAFHPEAALVFFVTFRLSLRVSGYTTYACNYKFDGAGVRVSGLKEVGNVAMLSYSKA